jgi:hypothetical protein
MLTDEQILESFRGMLHKLDQLEAAGETMYPKPTRARANVLLRLSHPYGRKLVLLDREWIADIEAELTPLNRGILTERAGSGTIWLGARNVESRDWFVRPVNPRQGSDGLRVPSCLWVRSAWGLECVDLAFRGQG